MSSCHEVTVMPELVTQEDFFYPGYRMPLYFEAKTDLAVNTGHNERYRCVLITSGNGVVTIDGHRKIFVSPAVYYMNESEHVDSVDSSDYSASVFYFHPEIVNSRFSFDFINTANPQLTMTERQDLFCLRLFMEKSSERKRFVEYGVASAIRIEELRSKVCAELSRTNHNIWPCLTRSYFLELLFFLRNLNAQHLSEEAEIKDEEVERILLYINANYHDKITIDDITRRFDTNRTTLSKRFMSVTGNSVIQYLNRYRINIAAMLLRDTSLPVNDIMYRVGFNDPTHFGKTFRQICGITPSSYRKNFNCV